MAQPHQHDKRPPYTNFFRGFGWAWNGLILFARNDAHGRFHLFAAIAVVSLGLLFTISKLEWILLFILIGMVVSAEMFNHALEKLCDKIAPARSEMIKTVKDVAAGAVLITSITALIGGILIFYPYLLEWISRRW